MPDRPILVARNIGPGELLITYGRKLRGIVLEQGSVGSHATIVARALAIPLVIQGPQRHRRGAERRSDPGGRRTGYRAFCGPRTASPPRFATRLAMQTRAQERYAGLRDQPAHGPVRAPPCHCI